MSLSALKGGISAQLSQDDINLGKIPHLPGREIPTGVGKEFDSGIGGSWGEPCRDDEYGLGREWGAEVEKTLAEGQYGEVSAQATLFSVKADAICVKKEYMDGQAKKVAEALKKGDAAGAGQITQDTTAKIAKDLQKSAKELSGLGDFERKIKDRVDLPANYGGESPDNSEGK
jgi:hypothetical protein